MAKTRKAEQVIPSSPEAEIALVGSIFFDPQVIASVVDVVAPRDFYQPEYRAIAQVLWDFWGESKPIDAALVYTEICRRQQEDVVGKMEGMMRIADATPESSHAAHYATIIKDKSRLRDLLHIGRQIIFNAMQQAKDTDAIIDDAHESIYRLAADVGRGTVYELYEGAKKEIEAIRAGVGDRHAVWTGFADVDVLTGGLHNGEMTILAAYPRMGKTTYALNVMEHLAKKGKRSVIFSLEVPPRQIMRNMMAIGAGVSVSKFRNQTVTDEEINKLETALEQIGKNVIWVTGQPKTSVEMKAIIRRLDARFDVSLVVIDYIQLFLKSADNRAGEMSTITRQIKLMGQELDKPLLVLSQLRRPLPGRETDPPTLSQLRESGSLEQDADIVMILHRSDPYKDPEKKGQEKNHLARLHVAKQKNGPEGFVKLYFREELLRFENFAEADGTHVKPVRRVFKREEPEAQAPETLPYKDAPERPEVRDDDDKKQACVFPLDEDGAPIWTDGDDLVF